MNDHVLETAKTIENKTFDEINVGDSAFILRHLTMGDVKLFAAISGDVNPAHVDEDYAKSSRFHEIIAHGMWGGTLISTVLGTKLPGPGTIYLGQTLRFLKPVKLGDVIRVIVTVKEKILESHRLILDCECENENGDTVIQGTAEVIAPTEKISRPRWIIPEVHLAERVHLHKLIENARDGDPIPTAVVHPVDKISILGIVAAYQAKLIRPILIGPEARIHAAIDQAGVDISDFPIINVQHSHAGADKALELIRSGKASILMKGSLPTYEFMQAVVDKSNSVRTERRMSHVMVFDVPTYTRPLFITDAAINIEPDLETKRDIIQNAIDVARALDIDLPKVAILAVAETVNPKMKTTLDAASLCKMADRGQIRGGLVDGPLAFDNAVSPKAVQIKHLHSTVAGVADILVAPDLESANMLVKQLEYLGGAQGAGVVVGAKMPIVLNSRADDVTSRVASCAIAKILAQKIEQRIITFGSVPTV